jgi:hypothetical protein
MHDVESMRLRAKRVALLVRPTRCTDRKGKAMTQASASSDAVSDAVERERVLLVQCIETAYESIRLMPGVDTSGRTLVWFAGHLLAAHRKAQDNK